MERKTLPILGPQATVVVPPCHDDVCITCSDAAVEVRVMEIHEGDLATVQTGSGLELISIALVDAAVGDVVLVHAKEAIAHAARPASEYRTQHPGAELKAARPSREYSNEHLRQQEFGDEPD